MTRTYLTKTREQFSEELIAKTKILNRFSNLIPAPETIFEDPLILYLLKDILENYIEECETLIEKSFNEGNKSSYFRNFISLRGIYRYDRASDYEADLEAIKPRISREEFEIRILMQRIELYKRCLESFREKIDSISTFEEIEQGF